MPDSFPSLPEARCSALEDFVRLIPEASSAVPGCYGRHMTPSVQNNRGGHRFSKQMPGKTDSNGRPRQRGRGPRANPKSGDAASPQASSGRKPGTSQYFGVRFRPDLKKFVAEIRVAEWKPVDKKVWLGTFEAEEAAARGVDLARKLLKCTKNHPPNLPCEKLSAFSKQLPRDLILTNLADPSMFKVVTKFIKRECKGYAASFDHQQRQSPPASIESGITTTDRPILNPLQSSSISSGTNPALGYESLQSSDVLDLDDANSDFSDLIHEYGMASNWMAMAPALELDTTGLDVDSYHYQQHKEVGESASTSSTCNSAASCMTLDSPSEWEVADCASHGMHFACCTGNSVEMSLHNLVPESVEMTEMTLAEQMQMDVGPVSRLCEGDFSVPFPNWPGLLPFDSSAFLAPLPADSTPPMHGACVEAGDLDLWSYPSISAWA